MRRTIGNMYHVPGNKLTGINWEYWETRARLGLDCSAFPSHPMQEGFFAYKTVLAPGNGVIRSIDIPAEYDKYIFDSFMLMHPGDVVTNYKSQPVGFLFMMFESEEEMLRVLVKEHKGNLVEVDSCQ